MSYKEEIYIYTHSTLISKHSIMFQTMYIYYINPMLVDDPPARRELRVWSRHLIFLGNQETVDKELCEILGKLSVTYGEDCTPPRRLSEEGTQTDFGQFRI